MSDVLDSVDDITILLRRLGRAQARLVATRTQLGPLQEQYDEMRRIFDEQLRLQLQLDAENRRLAALRDGFLGHPPTSPVQFGAALGVAADALQHGLLGLRNPQADYSLVELNITIAANLQIGDDGGAHLCLPSVDSDPPNNTVGRVHLTLRPVPKHDQ